MAGALTGGGGSGAGEEPVAESGATMRWVRGGEAFADGRYRRAHTWFFDGGIEVPASSSPAVVPLPLSDLAALDPEEAFVAALSSCHMPWFLSLAARRGFVVDRHEDRATGVLGRDGAGRTAMTAVTLRPEVAFAPGRGPGEEEFRELHGAAHRESFLADSVRTEVRREARRTGG